MVSIAGRNLFHQKTRLAISIFGIALAIVLILLIEGFAAGMYEQVTVYYENLGADLIVGQRGVDTMFAISTLPQAARNALAGVEGVREIDETFVIRTIFLHEDMKTPILLVGYRRGGAGGPWRIRAGREVSSDSEVVLDAALAARNDIEIGDRIELMGRNFRIVGLSAETNSWMSPYVFITEDAAQRLAAAEGVASYFYVKLDDSARAAEVERRIEDAVPGSTVLRPSEIAEENRALMAEIAGGALNVMVAVSFIIGVLVVGLTVQTAVLEKIREYGVLKAIGAGNARLYRIVLVQGFTSTFFGFLLGGALAAGAANLIEYLFPQFLISIGTQALVVAFVMALIMGLAASVAPVRRIAYVDPSFVFRG